MAILTLLNNSHWKEKEGVLTPLSVKADSKATLSALIAEQLPDFVRQDHTRLTEFMEAYYEWMEQKGEGLYSTFVLQDYSDIDTSISSFVDHFRNQYLEGFPTALAYDTTTGSAVDEKRLIKRIKDFYSAKGTEKAYRLLFRILHDATIQDFYYPKIDIIKSSFGKWQLNKSLKTTIANDSLWEAKDKLIFQKSGTGNLLASAFIRDIKKYHTENATIAELNIDNIMGEFQPEQEVTISIGGTTGDIKESLYTVIENITVTSGETFDNKGKNYRRGEKINIISPSTGGVGAKAEIVDVDADGGIVSVDIIDSGIDYLSTNITGISFDIKTVSGTGGGLTCSVGPITSYSGFYYGTDGQPSSNKRLFDNRFYQDFSYELKSDIALQTYKKEILNLIHPAGTRLFNQMLVKNTHGLTSSYKSNSKRLEISVLGHYTPYRFTTTENLRHNSQGKDLYPFGYNPYSGRAKGHIAFGVGVPGIQQVGEGDHIFLEATDGQKVIVNIKGSSATSHSGITSGTTLDCKTFASGGYGNKTLHATAQAVELATVINYHTKFIATSSGVTVDVYQAVSGTEGNNTITAHELGATGARYLGMTGGLTGAIENGVTAHFAETTRTSSYWGLVYNDEPGRTAQSDSITHGHYFAYNYKTNIDGATSALGGTFDAASGSSGPLYNTSIGAFISPYGITGYADLGLSGASAAYKILGTADAADWNNQGSYWVIYPHPNSRGIDNISSGISFADVKMHPFFYIDIGGLSAGVQTQFSFGGNL
tara:strand:- start:18078 stop:20375 length:2298 start_codon:yes stop_codon:yes gene_type:complete